MRLYRLCFLSVVLAAGNAAAAPIGNGQPPVSAAVLEGMRGGFTLFPGLVVSFGIERLAKIDGSVVSRTSLQIPNLGHLSPKEAAQTNEALSSVKLIQTGHDNIYAGVTPAPTAGALVIQNSLNDKVIRSETIINAGVNSLGILKAEHFQRGLAEALARAAGSY